MKFTHVLPAISVLLFILISCKKESAAPAPTIIGKWYVVKHASQLYSSSGKLIDSADRTSFTSSDYVQYFSGGTGLFSAATATSPSLSLFNFTLSGTTLTQITSSADKGTVETITKLTDSTLGIHYEIAVVDQNDPDQTDDEIDDFTFQK